MLIEIRHTSLRRNMYFLLMGTLMSRSTLVNDVNIIHNMAQVSLRGLTVALFLLQEFASNPVP